MDRGTLKYDRQVIIKHRICVEKIPEVLWMGNIKLFLMDPHPYIVITPCKQKRNSSASASTSVLKKPTTPQQ